MEKDGRHVSLSLIYLGAAAHILYNYETKPDDFLKRPPPPITKSKVEGIGGIKM